MKQEVNEASEGGWLPFLSRPYPVFPNGTKKDKILALFKILFYLIFYASVENWMVLMLHFYIFKLSITLLHLKITLQMAKSEDLSVGK